MHHQFQHFIILCLFHRCFILNPLPIFVNYIEIERFSNYFILMAFSLQQWRALFAGVLIMLVQGSLYVFGTLTYYIASYLYYHGQTNIEINDLQIIVTISVLCVNAGMIFPKFQIFSFSNRISALICVIGIFLSVFIISFSQSFILYVLIYGIMFGVSIGFGYVAPLKNCYEHLPDKKGLCSGVCIMGFGIGAFIFNFILLQLMNPDKQPFDQKTHRYSQQIANNLPFALRIMSAIYLALGLIGVFLISPKKSPQKLTEQTSNQAKNSLIQNNQQTSSQIQIKKSQIEQDENLTLKDILITKKVGLLMAILALTMPFGGFVAFYYKQYGGYHITSDLYFAVLGSVGSVMNGVSRMFWGFMMDRISFKAISNIINCLFILACGMIYFAVESEAMYMIVILITYCCYGGNFGIYPTQTMRVLGAKNGGKYYWITFTGFGIGAVLQFIIHFFLVNIYKQQGFKYCFIIFGVFLLLGTGLSIWASFQFHPTQLKYIKGWDLGKNQKKINPLQQEQDTRSTQNN